MGADYVELHCHSGFSLLDGASNPEALIHRAAGIGMPAIALTDHDDLGGIVRWAEAGQRHGIEAIVGLELTMAGPSHLTLLAMDESGYSGISRLVTAARAAQRGTPRATWEQLEGHAAGLFCLTGCPSGEVPSLLARGEEDAARERLGRLAEVFRGNVAVECWDHGLAEERALVPRLIALAAELDLPWTVTNDVHYAASRGRLVHDVLTCLRHGTTLDQAGTILRPSAAWRLKRPETMAHHWRHYPEALAATREIAERCRFRMKQLAPTLPAFPLPPGVDADEYLASLVAAGARERYGSGLTARHRQQLAHELGVIRKLGLAGYFLIVWDIVREAGRLGVLAQGRGSAANSAVCFCLGITAVDPIGMELLFERFLSEERREAPDIDIDFAHRDREQIIQYVYRRYGRDRAAMVCEAICYRGRSAVRDTARVLGFSVRQAERLAGEVEWHPDADRADGKLPEDGALEAGFDSGDRRVRLLMEVVRELQHLPRHRSIHSGGFVLTEQPLAGVAPIEPAAMDGRTVIQWDKDDLGPVNLIKIDLLGLGILTLLQEGIRLLRESRGIHFDLAKLPMDDTAVYDMICRADTIGVFQVESRAQMNTLPRLAPRCFYDLVVEVALIRPGPIQGEMVHPYLRRRAGEEPVTYPHPSLEPILERTLGVPLFQEQGMQVAISAAGFSPGQADELRRAMGHKRSHERMAGISRELLDGMARNGISPDAARRIFNQIAAFADYGFPESHAASFALLVYASAYLKHHYPAEFAAALLNAQPMGFYAPGTIVEDARRHGVEVRGPDVSRSLWDCSIEPGALRIGLRFVRGLGEKIRERLEPLLLAGVRPATLEGWARLSGLNATQLRSLAEAGAFDSIWPNRRSAIWELLKQARGAAGPLVPPAADRRPAPLSPLTAAQLTAADYRVTGMSPSGHPLRHLRGTLRRQGVIRAADVMRRRDGDRVTVGGLVICRQRPATAKGFCFVTLEDETGLVNVVVTPGQFEANRRLIVQSSVLVVRGVLEESQTVRNVKAFEFAAVDPAGGAEFARSHDFH